MLARPLRTAYPILVLVAGLLTLAPASGAQTAERETGVPRRAPVAAGSWRAESDAVRFPLLQSGSEKSVPVALLLSGVVFPGLGSFYAGHSRHGLIHASVAVLSGVILVSQVGPCLFLFGSDRDCSDADFYLDVSLAAWGVNYVWSLVSAVHDARAANAVRR